MSGKIRKYDVFAEISAYTGISTMINELLQAQAAEQSGEWTELMVEPTCDSDYCNSSWRIKGYRWETDKEFSKRMKDLEKAVEVAKRLKKKEKEDERKLYEKLKKKYGDK